MKYKNYEITRDDERNFKLVRHDTVIADKDIAKKDGVIVHRKGEEYQREVFKGYYPNIGSAISGIISDSLGEGCEDLKDILRQIQELRQAALSKGDFGSK